MGWAFCGHDDQGREIGYAIEAKCDHPGCDADIDRGLGYVCVYDLKAESLVRWISNRVTLEAVTRIVN